MSSDYVSVAFGRISNDTNATSSDITYLPPCTSSAVATYGKYNVRDANNFDIRQWDYYKGLLPSAIGGWVAAGICLLLALFFIIWLCAVCACMCCCGRGTGRRTRTSRDVAAIGMGNDPSKFFDRNQGFVKRHGMCSIFFCTFIVLLLLAMLGLGAWGLYEGLHAREDLSTNFFKTLAIARLKLDDLKGAVQNLSGTVGSLQASLAALSSALSGINPSSVQAQLNGIPALRGINLSGLLNDGAIGNIDKARETIGNIATSATNVANQIQTQGIDNINTIQSKKSTFDAVQDKWVPLVMGLMFGILALLAIPSVILLLCRKVRCGPFFLVLLWIWTALWFFVGPGLLHFGTRFTTDTCLYPENFVFRVVNDSSTFSNSTKTSINTGLQYYFGAFGPNITLDNVIKEVYGLDIGGVTQLANSSTIRDAVQSITNPAAQGILKLSGSLNATQLQQLSQAPQSLDNLIQDYNNVQRQASRSNFDDLYAKVKTLLCCQLGNRVRRAWIAWTVAATMAGLLCLALSLRTLQIFRWRKREAHGQPDSDEYLVGRRHVQEYGTSNSPSN